MGLLGDQQRVRLDEQIGIAHDHLGLNYPILYAPENDPQPVEPERTFSLSTLQTIIMNILEIIRS
jgi:hypothetical protein